ncbi:RNA polymerase sigma factor [Candidatus Parcubacteria bacterium]|nr:RNA polymerase sigma factor [Candidatus Parcubacteria bacterium]
MDKCGNKTDEELVELTLKDQDYLFCLTKRYETKLLSYILRISNVSKEEAEDILQEVFIKVYFNLNSFDKELKFSSWIYRITHNQVISNYRKIKARAETITFDFKDEIIKNIVSEFDIKEEIDYKIFREKIEKSLNNIDNKYKEVLILYLLEEKSGREISDILKKRINTVYSLISRGKKLLKKELDLLYN